MHQQQATERWETGYECWLLRATAQALQTWASTIDAAAKDRERLAVLSAWASARALQRAFVDWSATASSRSVFHWRQDRWRRRVLTHAWAGWANAQRHVASAVRRLARTRRAAWVGRLARW